MNRRRIERLALLTAIALPGCGDDGNSDSANMEGSGSATTEATSEGPTTGVNTDDGLPTTDASADSGSDDDTATGTATETSSTADCTDQMILDLGLVSGRVSAGGISNTADGDGWASTVDATAGGIVDAPTNPWIYLRFAPGGLEQVELDDIQALDSTDWDIAAKRFGIRLNGGVSGPSTVSAVDLEGTAYEDVTALPDGATLSSEAFYDETCTLVDDGTGQGSPNYRMTPWWSYAGCVGTTAIPFVIELADGSHVKLVVDAYYETGQDTCNDTGMMGMGSANFSWRWAYLE